MKEQIDFLNTSLLAQSPYQYSVLKAKDHGQQIIGVINLETIGYTSKKENSQLFVPGIDPKVLPKNNTLDDLSVGDFAFIISNDISQQLGKTFFEASKISNINLPSAWLHIALNYETIKQNLPDISVKIHLTTNNRVCNLW